jgi:hypothetical protein
VAEPARASAGNGPASAAALLPGTWLWRALAVGTGGWHRRQMPLLPGALDMNLSRNKTMNFTVLHDTVAPVVRNQTGQLKQHSFLISLLILMTVLWLHYYILCLR